MNNTIVLSVGTYVLTDQSQGNVLIENTSGLPSKTLSIMGAGESNTVIQPGVFPWQDRLFEIVNTGSASLSVVFQNLAIKGGNATGGGILGGISRWEVLLIDGGAVFLTNVAVSDNVAQGPRGADGSAGALGQAGGNAGNGDDAHGGGIYMASGSLTLKDDLISNNIARGGAGGSGGAGGNQHATKSAAAKTGAAGGLGGNGGSGAGGGLYIAGGTVAGGADTFATNQAVGGAGGIGGRGGDGILGKPGGDGANGGDGGAAQGGGFYINQGTLNLDLSTVEANSAVGGAGGAGGAGGGGSSLLVTTSLSVSLSGGTIFSGSGGGLTNLFHGGAGGKGGAGGNGGAGAGAGLYVAGGSLTIFATTLANNQATGGQGGFGGKGGTAGFPSISGILSGFGTIPLGGSGGSGGNGGSGAGGGVYLAGGTVSLNGDTLNANIAKGGAGGTGGTGGDGGLAGGLSGLARVSGHRTPGGVADASSTSIPIGASSGGPGGNGGTGGQGNGGAFYVAGGALTLSNLTVADNSVQGGAGGSGGIGGKGGSLSEGNGPAGQSGSSGGSNGGGFYVDGGRVSLYNSTIALNKQIGVNGVGGVIQIAGTVNATSTIFAGNGTVDYSGDVVANYCLFQTTPINGTVNSTNLVGVNPLPAAAGLAANGGPTETIALQTNSPAIDKGTNPENLFTDQRGGSPRTGSGGTDIGAVQHDAKADAVVPTASVSAPNVTAAGSTTYNFTITYADNVAIAASTLAGATVQVIPPAGMAPITATVKSMKSNGATNALGDASGFVVSYQITPPGGSWTASDNGTYIVTLGGEPVTDLAGNMVPAGNVATFSVEVPYDLVVTSQPPSSLTAGTSFGLTVKVEDNEGNVQTGFNGAVTIALANNPDSGKLNGTLTTNAKAGVAIFSQLTLDQAANGYTIQATSSGLIAATTNSFNVTPAAASALTIANLPASVLAGTAQNIAVTAYDTYGNIATGYTGTIKFTSSDAKAILPASYQFVAANKGTHSFSVTFNTTGQQSVTVTDTVTASITGTARTTVTASSIAAFVREDTTTQGNWIGAYGSQGYDIVSGPTSLPSYAALTTSGASTYTWSNPNKPSALQLPGSSNRVAAVWYSATSFSINLGLTDGQTHDIALYACDYDNLGRSEQIQITNAATGAILDTESISSFSGGVYLQWRVSGSVVITITKLAGPNAVVNGVFVDPETATATFVKEDTTTQGNWIGAYGSQGYDIVSGPTSLPSYAALTTSGASTYTWSNPNKPSALQLPGSSNRVAAVWYSATNFSISLNLTDGQTHDIALYACDYDNLGRSEQIQITNAATGAILDTETISSFSGGVYLQWKVAGNVIITITKLAGPNAVVNGVFADPVATTAAFVKDDTTTQGNWIGAYGSQGYDIVSGPTSLPSYAALTTSGASTYTWSNPNKPSALQLPGSSNRVAAVWYSATNFSISLNLTDGQTHDIALYACDYDNLGRSEQIQITNAATGAILDTESISSFSGGVYLQWRVSGSVVITITKLAGPNAVVNGVFVDPETATATFVKEDTTTQGNWIGAYGSQGYDIVSGPTSLPSYAALTTSGASTYTWSNPNKPSALQLPGSSNRVAAVWYSATNFSISLNLTDGQTHDIALYACDYDNLGRSEQIQITNAATGAILDTETISSFSGGVYLQWRVSGSVVITITKLAGPNAVVNGVFVDPETATATFVKEDTTTQGNWIGAYGSQGYDIVSGPTSLPSYAALTTSGASTYTWSNPNKPSALQLPGSSNRVAAVWYSATNFSISLNLTDGQTHDIALYACDYDNLGARNRFRSRTPQPEQSSTRRASPVSPAGSVFSGRYREM